MVKKNHEAVVLGEKIDPAGTKNQQGRRLEDGAEEGEGPGAEGWDATQKHWGFFSSLLRTSKMISRSRGINLCVSSPPGEAAVNVPVSTHSDQHKCRLPKSSWEEPRGGVGSGHWRGTGEENSRGESSLGARRQEANERIKEGDGVLKVWGRRVSIAPLLVTLRGLQGSLWHSDVRITAAAARNGRSTGNNRSHGDQKARATAR